EAELRTHPLAARGERLVADRGDDPRMRRDRPRQALLERVEVRVEAGSLADRGERRGHEDPACPTCKATIPPARKRNETSSKPARPSIAASSSGPGKRLTLAGRYVYAEPPGRSFPASGISASNQSR